MDFQAPEPAPYPNWDIHKTKPLPYRPFKHGPKYMTPRRFTSLSDALVRYHITMGLRKMDFDEWIGLVFTPPPSPLSPFPDPIIVSLFD